MITGNGNKINFKNHFARHRNVFITLGGPSLLDVINGETTINGVDYQNKDLLNHDSVMVMGVNNYPKLITPDLWTHVDHPAKYFSAIWDNPKIMKFSPKQTHSKITTLKLDLRNPETSPNTFIYDGTYEYSPSQFITANEPIAIGGVFEKYGNTNHETWKYPVVSVVLASINLAMHLGFRNIFLLGCDFNITPNDDPLIEKPLQVSSDIKNDYFTRMENLFDEVYPDMKTRGFNIVNCNLNSHLNSFPKVAFPEVIKDIYKEYEYEQDTPGKVILRRSQELFGTGIYL